MAVEPQVFDVLVHLIRHRDRVVSKDDLLASIWHGRIVSESALFSRINSARNAIGDTGERQHLIKTLPRKGLRFVGEVREDPIAAMPAAPPRQTPAQHPASADAATGAATRPSDPEIVPDKPSIAVLPFTNMSGDADQDYFVDGVTEDVITALSKWRWFLVIARNSTFAFKGRAMSIKQVGAGARCPLRARGQRAAGGEPRSHHGAADRRQDRSAHLGGALRPRYRRYLRRPGRNCAAGRDHHRPGHPRIRDGPGKAQAAGKHGCLGPFPQGAATTFICTPNGTDSSLSIIFGGRSNWTLALRPLMHGCLWCSPTRHRSAGRTTSAQRLSMR